MGTMLDRFSAALDALAPPKTLGLAVSGGSDSMAMLGLTHRWARGQNITLMAATIDHGLRAESRDEAATVGQCCRALGIPHHILPWQGAKPPSNLQAHARQARRELLRDWAEAQGVGAVMMAHTADDQAETVLMRLQRGSGVDGLAGMSASSWLGSVRLLRPMLGLERAALRAWLTANHNTWIDDPSNEDDRFNRVAMRKAMSTLGIPSERVALAAAHMAAAREVLERAAFDLAREAVTEHWSTLVMDPGLIARAPGETRERVWAGAIQWLTGQPYKPRLHALRRVIAATARGEIAQLDGVVALPDGGRLRLARDYAQFDHATLDAEGHWAGLTTQAGADLCIRPAGPEGLAALAEWRAQMPRRAALAEPMVYRGNQALGFVHGRLPPGLRPRPIKASKTFAQSLLTQEAH